jgi:hypothetical protein
MKIAYVTKYELLLVIVMEKFRFTLLLLPSVYKIVSQKG